MSPAGAARRWLAVGALAVLAACSATPIRTAAPSAAAGAMPVSLPDELLQDVDIAIFDPGIDSLPPQDARSTPAVRRAEAHYCAQRLKETLERSGEWGAVRVVPSPGREVDLTITGEVIASDGRELTLAIAAADATGSEWFARKYTERVERHAYDAQARALTEPFQPLYDRIAADLRERLSQQDHARLAEIRAVAELRFAARFAPAAFAGHLAQDRERWSLRRLPAEDDPQLARVRRIRVRDALYVDQLQTWYRDYDTAITPSYDYWREASLLEAQARRSAVTDAVARTLGGVLAVAAGVLAQGSDSALARTTGVIGMAGGAALIGSGLERGADARRHGETLRQLSESLGAEVAPQSIALAERTVELTGTVEEQYAQWRALLEEIYRTETAVPETLPAQATETVPPGGAE